MTDDVIPFRGLHYDPHVTGPLDVLTAPPDLSSDEPAAYHDRSPYNVARLLFGIAGLADSADDNRYTRARSQLLEWRRSGVLKRETDATFYLYEQEWDEGGSSRLCMGLVALGRLPDGTRPAPAPRADERFRLMQACHAAFAMAVERLDDAAGDLYDVLERMHYEADDQRAEYRDAHGVLHRFKSCHGAHYLPKVRAALAGRERSLMQGAVDRDAALRYRDWLASQSPASGPASCESFALTALYSSRDPGLPPAGPPPLHAGLVIHKVDDEAIGL